MNRKLKHEVLRLHRENPQATNTDIANIIGSIPQYVSVTLKRNGMKAPRRTPVQPFRATIPNQIAERLRPSAENRCLTIPELVVSLLRVIAADKMVDAILDDADSLLEAAE